MFAVAGLYVREVLAKREAEQASFEAHATEYRARREAEEQLSLLVGSSALAILALNDTGLIVQANDAARQMLLLDRTQGESLVGMPIRTFVPALDRVVQRANPERPLRTVMQSQGFRITGEPFLAEVWFSGYETTTGRRTAAMIVDASEALRDREESALEQLLNSSRLAVGVVAHEMRNVSSAIQLVERNLLRSIPALAGSPDFLALQQLTSTLERMASTELSHLKRQSARLPLRHCLEELHIVSQAMLRDNGIELYWDVEQRTPAVWADQQGLMQVFLNLLRNAQNALAEIQNPCVTVGLLERGNDILLQVSDNGPGVPAPETLFRAFEAGVSNLSFGLYLSRAILNSFQSDLVYEPLHPGARFTIVLQKAS